MPAHQPTRSNGGSDKPRADIGPSEMDQATQFCEGPQPASGSPVGKTYDAFQCPECGSRNVESEWETAPRMAAATPWERVGWIILCGGCGLQIPALLGRRWQGRTVAQARLEWEKHYRRRAFEIRCC